MKRRLPTTYQGEIVFGGDQPAAGHCRREPPRAEPAPSGQAGGRGERGADRGQREPARSSRRRDRLTAQLHGQRRERRPQLRGASPEPVDPAAGGRIWHPRPFRGRGGPRTRRRPPA